METRPGLLCALVGIGIVPISDEPTLSLKGIDTFFFRALYRPVVRFPGQACNGNQPRKLEYTLRLPGYHRGDKTPARRGIKLERARNASELL